MRITTLFDVKERWHWHADGDIIFSQRLSGLTMTITYAALIIGLSAPVIRHMELRGTPEGTMLMSIGLVLAGLLLTLGWRWCVRSQSQALVKAYFIGTTLLTLALFWLESADTQDGASVSNLFVVLMIQTGVLPVTAKLAYHLGVTFGLTTIVLVVFNRENIATNTLVVMLTFGALVLIGHIVVRDEQTQKALEAAHRQLAEYAAQAEELATMRERNRLAREIHDNLGHYLTVVNTQIEAARAIMAADPERGAYLLERAQSLTKEGLSEIRRSVSALRAAPVEARPLPEALQALIEEHASSGLTIHYQIDGQPRPSTSTIEQALYRAAQEGLTNIRRHAQATHADILLRYLPDRIALSIRDDGAGRPVGTPGFGLIGLQERMKLLNGIVQTEAVENVGFTLHVEVPA